MLKRIQSICGLLIEIAMPFGLLLLIPLTKFSEIKINVWLYLATALIFPIFVLAYFITINEGVLRACTLIFINLFLFTAINTQSWRVNSGYVADQIYWINILILVASYIFDPIAFFFSKQNNGIERLGGLLGYDYVGFLVSIYIISKIESKSLSLGWPLFLHLCLATIVVLNSGRFGFLILIVLYLFILHRFTSVKTLLIFSLLALFSYALNAERVNLIISSFSGIYEYMKYDSLDTLKATAGNNGFYALSPLSWYSEFSSALAHPEQTFFPSPLHHGVDSGPAYMIVNTGLALTFLYYLLFFLFLRLMQVNNFFMILIILITDLKFKTVFSVFPMFWIYINFAHIKRL